MSFATIAITSIVALLSLILGGIVTRYYSYRRQLVLVVPSFFDVIDLSRVAKKKVQILYNQKNITSLWVVRVLVQNRGNVDIQKDMIRRRPLISFGDKIEAIDVEPVYVPTDSVVTAELVESGGVSFSIDYLQRRKQAAFQILVHSPTNTRFSAKDLRADTGSVENTKVDFINLSSGGVPSFMDTLLKLIRSHRKAITVAYILLSFGLILFGLFALVQPLLAKTFPALEATCQPTRVAVFVLIYGCLLLFPTWSMWRRVRFLSVFDVSGKDGDGEVAPKNESSVASS